MKFLLKSFFKWISRKIYNPKYRWMMILGGLFYLLSPFDISPDMFPVIGWLDDAAILGILTTELANLLVAQYNTQKIDREIDPSNVTIDVKATPV
jgi:uncharacterized membrane protein YkvA (DUF1232 family)